MAAVRGRWDTASPQAPPIRHSREPYFPSRLRGYNTALCGANALFHRLSRYIEVVEKGLRGFKPAM